MAERVTDLRDIERRVTARLVGEPEPGVPDARPAVGAGRRGPRARRHRRPRRRDGRRPGRPRRAARPATPRSSPASSASPAWSAWPASPTCATATAAAGRRHDRARSTLEPGRRRRPSGVVAEAARGRAAALGPLDRPGPHRRRHAGQAARQRRRRRLGARDRGRRPGRGRRAVPHRAVLPQPQGRADVEEQAEIYAGVLAPFGGGPLRRGPHPGRRLGQADRVRDPRGRGEPGARRPRAAAVLRQPRPDGAPARRHRAGGRAHRHRDLGDGADGRHRRRGRGVRRARCAATASRRA